MLLCSLEPRTVFFVPARTSFVFFAIRGRYSDVFSHLSYAACFQDLIRRREQHVDFQTNHDPSLFGRCEQLSTAGVVPHGPCFGGPSWRAHPPF